MSKIAFTTKACHASKEDDFYIECEREIQSEKTYF